MNPWRRMAQQMKRRLRRESPEATAARARKLLIATGDEARNRADWPAAIKAYAAALAMDSGDAALHVQHGHALKEDGRAAEAELAYRAAIAVRPNHADAYLHLGHMLKVRGDPAGALDAYAQVLAHAPENVAARQELTAAGAHDRIPRPFFSRGAVASRLAGLEGAVDRTLRELEDWRAASVLPVEAYGMFRDAYGAPPPPPMGDPIGGVTVLVDARTATPAEARVTLHSLLDQRERRWRAVVLASGLIRQHPVASLAAQDSRIVFVGKGADAGPGAAGEEPAATLLISAGTHLDLDALGWLRYALDRTGAPAVRCDHDHYRLHWRRGLVHLDPALQSPAVSPEPWAAPAAVMVKDFEGLGLDAGASGGAGARLDALRRAATHGAAAHLPRILASVPVPSEPAVMAAPVSDPPAGSGNGPRLRVIIPTRDEAALLEACVDSLRSLAAAPDRLQILVLNNRSQAAETLALLERWRAGGHAEVRDVDEPFNWARFNNQAAGGEDTDILVFANNDMEMLTPGWDDILRARLARPEVGVVGVRLLYPDRSIQHAGIALGGHDGRPVHEGLGEPGDNPGPLGRWRQERPAAAVTGAFMAIAADVFRRAGGFDERLAVAYNDLDLCFKVRSLGLQVLYVPAIELVHHESKTRGQNDNPEKIAWDDGELHDLFARWGEAMFHDPGVNPHWVGGPGRRFDGLRDLSPRQILESLDNSARDNPWRLEARTDGGRLAGDG